jgi:hypothetical protein
MKVITPVVTKDIIAYLLRYVNDAAKFSKVYKCMMSEANLVRA